MSLSSYLASKYLNAEPSSSSSGKKRKRKDKSSTTGLIIADDDALGWNTSSNNPNNSDDDRPTTISSGSAEFRKAKKNAWKTVGVPAPSNDELEADRIIPAAAIEGRGQDDEEPAIDDSGIIKMGDGTHAGLQSAAAVAKQFEKRKREEKEAWDKEQVRSGKGKKGEEETVYRDATGRRIDLSMRRAEARREAEAEEKKKKAELEAQKGEVQLAEKARRREELDEARFLPLARTIDDLDMNAEMKEKERWNDPAMQFLSKQKKGKSKTGKPLYTGAAAPNRYGIRPGHKWDGVDRGNGWEGERFKALNRTTRNKELDYSWQMDE